MSDPEITKTRALPPEARDLEMPDGTPLGIGFLGVARFAAIRHVLEVARRAAQAKADLIDAQSDVGSAIIRRELVLEQLDHLDLIRKDEADRIRIGHEARIEEAEIAKLQRKVDRMELEDQIATKEAARRKAAERNQPSEGGVAKDAVADFMDTIKRWPEIQKAAAAAREEMLKNAGGEDKLSESGHQRMEMFDAMINAFMEKQAAGTAL